MLDQRLLGLARERRGALLLTVACGVAIGALLVWQARALAGTVDAVFLGHRALAGVAALLWTLLALALGRAFVSFVGDAAAASVAAQAKTTARERLFARLLALGPAYVRGERSGELANTLVGGVDELDAWYSQYLPQVALCLLVPAIILCAVFPLDPLSGLVLLLSAPLIPLFMALIGSLSAALTRRQWGTLSHMSAHFLDVLQGLTTLKLFGRSRRQTAIIARISDDFRRATMRVLRVAFLSALVLELIATLSTAMVAVEIGVRLLGGGISFGRAFFILILAPEFYLPLRTLGARYHAAMSGKAASKRIFDLLDTPLPTVALPTSARLVPEAPLALAFRAVDFTYASGSRPALDGVTFSVPAGKMVALVGPSGAGKSTVASLLLRFLEPQSGAVEVNGVALGELDAAVWRERIAWVPQRPYLFAASVAENIRLGRAEASDDEVLAAARLAQAHDFIAALPQGYETPLGERGARLSGGQAQRIALARAFLRDAPLLLLDEVTSQLDAESEDALRASLDTLASQRTTLVIAHRLSTIYRADAIVVLDAGRVAGCGTHAELLKVCPVYRGLVSAAEGVATWTL